MTVPPRIPLPDRSKNVLRSFPCATVQKMWPFRRRHCEEKKSNRLIKRLIVGLIIGGAIGSIVGGKVLEKHRKEHGINNDED